MSGTRIEGIGINYTQIGAGPDVLLLHGWASSTRLWARTAQRLADAGYRATALDLPGFGRSEQPPFDWYSAGQYTRFIVHFCQQLQLARPAVVGHSLGAALALSVAAEYPVSAVMACAPVVNGRLGLNAHRWFTSRVTRRALSLAQASPLWPALSDLHPVTAPGLVRSDVWRRNQEDFGRTTFKSVAGSLRAVVQLDLSDRLPLITAPTLILIGGRDFTVPNSQGRLAARLIPAARLVCWPRTGHSPIDERPREFDQLLLQHLRDHVSATR